MDYYFDAFRRYFDFKGRTSRKAYWMFVLFNYVITGVLNIFSEQSFFTALIGGVYGLVIVIPLIASEVRRLHDVGKSGWWVAGKFILNLITFAYLIFILINFIPMFKKSFNLENHFLINFPLFLIFFIANAVVTIYVFILKIKKGDAGKNKYGSSPELNENNDANNSDENKKEMEELKPLD